MEGPGAASAVVERTRFGTAMAIFCVLTLLVIVPRDLFVAHTRDVEVWFGFEMRGAAALATAPLHWAIFAAGAWGFWRARPWVWPWASGYAFYVAFCHLVWSETSVHGNGWAIGLLQAAGLLIPAVLLLRMSNGSRGGAL